MQKQMEADEAGLAQGDSEVGDEDETTTVGGNETGERLRLFYPVWSESDCRNENTRSSVRSLTTLRLFMLVWRAGGPRNSLQLRIYSSGISGNEETGLLERKLMPKSSKCWRRNAEATLVV